METTNTHHKKQTMTMTIPTSDLKVGDVIIVGGEAWNINAGSSFEVVDRYDVIAIDDPAPQWIGIAAGQVRTEVEVQRIKADGGHFSSRRLSFADTVNIESR